MGKKRKGNRPPSKRGHDESSYHRYRQVTALIPVDRDNNPIKVPRKELAKSMLEVTGHKTTHAEQSIQPPEPELPKNVVSLCDRRQAANEVKYTTSQEAQANINYDRLLFHEWSKKKGKRYVSSNEADAHEFRRLLQYAASHPNGRNHVDDNDLSQQKPISTVHNPGISSTPIEHGGYSPTPYNKRRARPIVVHNRMNREGQVILYDPRIHAPSGLPIKEFTEGKYAPPKTQQSTEVQTSEQNRVTVSNANSTWTTEEQLYLMLDMVPQEHWPMAQLRPYLFQNDNGKWCVHTGKVRTAVSNNEDRGIHRAVALAFIRKTEDQDDYISALEADQQGLQSQLRILDFQYSTLLGEPAEQGVKGTEQFLRAREKMDWTPQGARRSARELSRGYATANAKPPTKQQLVAEQQRIQERINLMDAEEQIAKQKRFGMIRMRILFKHVPELIRLTQERRKYMASAEHQLMQHRRMVFKTKFMQRKVHTEQRVNLSGLIVHLVNQHWSKMKVTINGEPTIREWDIRSTATVVEYPHETKRTKHRLLMGLDSVRDINKAVGVMNLPVRYHPIEPTINALGNRPEYAEFDNTTARMKRWAKWLPVCEERDTDRQRQQQEQASHEAAQRAIEQHREVLKKPLNKAINKVSLALEKAWQFGNRDVFVTPWEKAKREENARILRQRTENETREQAKLEEKERREEAEREARRAARREERRRKKDQKRAAKAQAEEQAAAKAAAKAAFKRAH